MSWRILLTDAALAAVVAAIVIGIQLRLARAGGLLAREFWVDEIVTHTLVTDPQLTRALRALAGGADTNPPAYHLLMRVWRRLVGVAGERSLRLASLGAMVLALAGMFAALRPVWGLPAAAVSALFLWSHPLVQRHALEARMYGLWLAASVWFALWLDRLLRHPDDGVLLALTALTGVLLCMVHTLAVLSALLIVAAQLAVADTVETRVLAAAVAGPLAFAAWSPFTWRQNQAYTQSWVTASWSDVKAFARSLFVMPALAPVLLLGGLAAALQPAAIPAPGTGAAVVAGLASLAVLPAILLVFSYAFQPLTLDRYALPAAAALALAAGAVSRALPAGWLVVVGLLLFGMGVSGLRRLKKEFAETEAHMAKLLDALRRHTAGNGVLFESPLELHRVCRYAPDLAPRCFGLDFEMDQLQGIDGHRVGGRDQLRSLARVYARPSLMPWTEARRFPWLFLVPSLRNLERGFPDPPGRYPGFVAAPRHWPLFELRREAS